MSGYTGELVAHQGVTAGCYVTAFASGGAPKITAMRGFRAQLKFVTFLIYHPPLY